MKKSSCLYIKAKSAVLKSGASKFSLKLKMKMMMKNYFYFLTILMIGLISCSSNGDKNSTDSDTNKIDSGNKSIIDTIPEANQVNPHPIPFPEHLKKYLTDKQVDSFELAANQYYNIKSSANLAEFYNKTLPALFEFINQGIRKSNPEVEYSGDDAPMAEWNVFQEYMPCIVVECLCGECSTEPIVNLMPLNEKAKQTPESDDDKYFNLAIEMYRFDTGNDSVIYDGGGNIATWYTMDGCDFCSYSNLGENIIYKLLKLSDESLAAGKNFEENTRYYRNRIMPAKNTHYGVTKKEVLAEIAKILKECKLNEEERKQIMETQLDIKNNKEVQFNCKNGACTYEY